MDNLFLNPYALKLNIEYDYPYHWNFDPSDFDYLDQSVTWCKRGQTCNNKVLEVFSDQTGIVIPTREALLSARPGESFALLPRPFWGLWQVLHLLLSYSQYAFDFW